MDHPVAQAILYGLRRHWLALVFLLIGAGAVLGSLQFSGDKKEAHDKADSDLSSAQASFVTDIEMKFKPDKKGVNKRQAGDNLERIKEFFDTASEVFQFDVNATYEGDFMRHLKVRVDELNDLAASNRVQLPNTLVSKGQTNRKYHFTFGLFQTNAILPADQIEGLALALHDVQKIAGIFLTSNIMEVKGIQRTRMVQLEDSGLTGTSQAYTDDLKHYSNVEETLEGYPYRVTFVCYPEALATVLRRIASFPAGGNGIYITRNVKIESIIPGKEKDKDGGDMMGGGDLGGLGGGGGFGGGGPDPDGGDGGSFGGGDGKKKGKTVGLPEASIEALAASDLGSKSASTAIGERLLRVELHLDIIRRLLRHADGREAGEEEEEGF